MKITRTSSLYRVNFDVEMPILLTKEDNEYVAWCPAVDVASQGDTKKEAREMLIEAVGLFLIDCYERGVLDDVMHESGFEASREDTQAPQFVPQAGQILESIRVPINLLAAKNKNNAASFAC